MFSMVVNDLWKPFNQLFVFRNRTIFIEHILYSRLCSSGWGCISKRSTKVPALMGFVLQRGEVDNKQMNK